MQQKDNLPYKNQLLVCVHTRNDGRKSCGDQQRGAAIAKAIKDKAKSRGLDKNGQLRVVQTGCLGLCGQGPNVILQAQTRHFSQVSSDDADAILDSLES